MKLNAKVVMTLFDKDDNNREYKKGDIVDISYIDEASESAQSGTFIILDIVANHKPLSPSKYPYVELQDIKYKDQKHVGEIGIFVDEIKSILPHEE